MYVAFQHSNGFWYVAWVGDSGFHKQPLDATLSEKVAKNAASRKNREYMNAMEN